MISILGFKFIKIQSISPCGASEACVDLAFKPSFTGDQFRFIVRCGIQVDLGGAPQAESDFRYDPHLSYALFANPDRLFLERPGRLEVGGNNYLKLKNDRINI